MLSCKHPVFFSYFLSGQLILSELAGVLCSHYLYLSLLVHFCCWWWHQVGNLLALICLCKSYLVVGAYRQPQSICPLWGASLREAGIKRDDDYHTWLFLSCTWKIWIHTLSVSVSVTFAVSNRISNDLKGTYFFSNWKHKHNGFMWLCKQINKLACFIL